MPCVCCHSVMSNSVIPWAVAHKLPLSMELSGQEFWIRLPFPTWPRNHTCVSFISCIGRQILYHWATWEALYATSIIFKSCFHYFSEVMRDVSNFLKSQICFQPSEFLFVTQIAMQTATKNCYCFKLCFKKVPYRRRRRHPTPVLLPGKSHGRRGLVGCSPWGR